MKTRGYGSISLNDGNNSNDVEAANKDRCGGSSDDDNNRRVITTAAYCCYSVRVLIITILLVVVLIAFVLSATKGGIRLNSNSINEIHPILGSSSVTSSTTKVLHVPFLHVDRSTFGKNPIPASSIIDPSLFSPSLLGKGMNNESSSSSSLLNVPFPTGSFWTNLVVEPTADRLFSYPIMAYPYSYKWNPTMIQVSLPSLRRLMDTISIRDIFIADITLSTKEDDIISHRQVTYFDPLSVTLRFLQQEEEEEKEDEGTDESNLFWETYIVQGSPYITAKYNNMTPVIKTLSIFQGISCLKEDGGGVCTEEEEEVSNDDGQSSSKSTTTILSGSQFVLQTRENLTWLMFVSQPVKLVFDRITKTTITTKEPFSGIIRLSLIPPPQKELTEYTEQFPDSYNDSSIINMMMMMMDNKNKEELYPGLQRIIDHSNEYPIGADISWTFPSKDIGQVEFHYKTKSMSDETTTTTTTKKATTTTKKKKGSELLMLALPHHVDGLLSTDSSSNHQLLLRGEKDFDLVYRTIKGPMTAVLGSVWTVQEDLTSIGFEDKSTLDNVNTLDNGTKKIILDQVVKDVKRVLPTMDENVYGYGKQVARLAQLVHIANVLLEPDHKFEDTYDSAVQDAQDTLYQFVTDFLSGRNDDNLVYDVNFGGLVTKDGLDDFMNDFGNGWYNDHHFHYGYYLYACALLGKWNSTFVSEYGPRVDVLMYDVASSSHASSEDIDDGSFFPLARHKSWFDGHSFASGLFPFASGKSMESSSESINCYYGAYLWSSVVHSNKKSKANSDQFNFARLLLAMEIKGVKTYWHMEYPNGDESKSDKNGSHLYNPVFGKNLMVGNLGMMDATVSTWFGNNLLYVHMINFMPVTAITRELFNNKSYLKKEYESVIKPIYDNVEMAWKGYVICDYAMLDPNQAWNDALKLRSYELDQAVSQSQVLYFISTTNGFEGSKEATANSVKDLNDATSSENSSSQTNDSASSEFCMDHPKCNEAQLTGECCPTSNGIFLGCCDSIEEQQERTSSTKETTTTTTTTTPGGEPSAALSNNNNNNDSAGPQSCSEHKGCVALGVTGKCCPTDAGVTLSCCS